MKICVICPVRNGTPIEVYDHVEYLEGCGHEVYLPPRDTPQDNPVGFEICRKNCLAIQGAEEIHVYYEQTSQGIHFDLGMAFALRKPIYLINEVEDKDGKSFIKVIKKVIEITEELRYNQGLKL